MHKTIFVEGISGSGKSTITQETIKFLEQRGIRARKIDFPTNYLRPQIREARAREKRDLILETYLFASDARHQYTTEITLELERTIFVSDRSYFSACVYCQIEGFNVQDILALNRANPTPDLLFILDCTPELALERIIQRARQGGKPQSRFENLKDLTHFRARYQGLVSIVPSARMIDTSRPFSEVWNDVEKYVLKEALG